MSRVRLEHRVRDETPTGSRSHRVPLTGQLARQRMAVNAYRVRAAAVAVKTPHRRRPGQVQIERRLLPHGHRLAAAVLHVHRVMHRPRPRSGVPCGDNLQRRLIATKPQCHFPSLLTFLRRVDKSPRELCRLVARYGVRKEAKRHASIDPIPPCRRAGKLPNHQLPGGRHLQRQTRILGLECPRLHGRGSRLARCLLKASAPRLRRKRLVNSRMPEIVERPLPDPKLVDQPSKRAFFIRVTESHGHRHRRQPARRRIVRRRDQHTVEIQLQPVVRFHQRYVLPATRRQWRRVGRHPLALPRAERAQKLVRRPPVLLQDEPQPFADVISEDVRVHILRICRLYPALDRKLLIQLRLRKPGVHPTLAVERRAPAPSPLDELHISPHLGRSPGR